MPESTGGLAFTDESATPPEVLAIVATEHLEGDDVAQEAMTRAINRPHPSFTEQRFDLVDLVEQRANEDFGIRDERLTVVVTEVDVGWKRHLALRAYSSADRCRRPRRCIGDIGRIVGVVRSGIRLRCLGLSGAREQELDLTPQRCVSGTGFGKHLLPFWFAEAKSFPKEALDASVTRRVHSRLIMGSSLRLHNSRALISELEWSVQCKCTLRSADVLSTWWQPA